MLTEKEARQLLSKLCVNLGFCDADNRFFELKLETVDEFTKAVLRAEGLDLEERSDLYKQLRQIVAEAFKEHLNRLEIEITASVFVEVV